MSNTRVAGSIQESRFSLWWASLKDQWSLHPWHGIRPIAKKVIQIEFDGWLPEVLSTIAIPLSFFLAFGLGLGHYMTKVDGYPYMVFLTPGLISLTLLLEAYKTGAWGLWMGRWHTKMINEYRIKPISTSDIIIGEMLGGFCVALIKGSIVASLLFLLSPFSTHWLNLIYYFSYLIPGCILFTCVGTLVGTSFQKPDQIAQSQTIVITPLLYLGGLFFPVSTFPDWVQPLVRWLPTTALFEGGRAAFLAGHYDWRYGAALLVSAFISFVIAILWFNRALSK